MIKYFILLLILNVVTIYSYLVFPLKYLPNDKYKFIDNININTTIPEEIMQQIYFRNLMTEIEIGTPTTKIPLFIETNIDKFYISSINPSINSTNKDPSKFYQFKKSDFYDETSSFTYANNICKINGYSFYPYDEICDSNENITFNLNKTKITTEFPIKLVRNLDENIPGYIGLLHNDLEFKTTTNLITGAEEKKIINNYFWFFNFDEFNPLEKKINGQLIIGGIPHEIFPIKYSIDDLKTTSSYKSSMAGRSWRLLINKISIDNQTNNDIHIDNRIVTFRHDIYNIITTNEFHNIIKNLIMDEMVKQNKCFKSNFTQNIYKNYNLTFYYCYKSAKEILYEKIPNLKFFSVDLNYTFQLTKEELFYEKNNYIYFMIIFSDESNTNWMMGQIFISKYNFVYNNDNHQIGLYKANNRTKYNNINGINYRKGSNNKISTGALIAIIAVADAIIFTIVGLILGKLIFNKKGKTHAHELSFEKDYNYTSKDNNDFRAPNNDFRKINEQYPIRVKNKNIN